MSQAGHHAYAIPIGNTVCIAVPCDKVGERRKISFNAFGLTGRSRGKGKIGQGISFMFVDKVAAAWLLQQLRHGYRRNAQIVLQLREIGGLFGGIQDQYRLCFRDNCLYPLKRVTGIQNIKCSTRP